MMDFIILIAFFPRELSLRSLVRTSVRACLLPVSSGS